MTEAAAEVEYLGTVVRAMSRLLLVGVGGQFYKVKSGNIEYDECCTPYLKEMGNLTEVSIVKLREREGQGVDSGRSLKGDLKIVDCRL